MEKVLRQQHRDDMLEDECQLEMHLGLRIYNAREEIGDAQKGDLRIPT